MTNKSNAVLKQECHSPKSLWGIFRVRNTSEIKVSKGYEEDPRQQSSGMTTLLNFINPSPALRAPSPARGEGNNFHGFTLIELLVVILIIAILATIALPQYQVAVAKSRLMQGFVLGKAIQEAEERYYLANGTYTKDLADLDIDIHPVKTEQHSSYKKTVSVNTLANGYTVQVAINGAGSVEDRVEIRTAKGEQKGITFYFNHVKKYFGTAGQRACFADTTTYYQACTSMGGKGIYTMGKTKVYLLP